jgi:hypothetical protein
VLSTVVHASGCASLLLYVLLYRVDVQVSEQFGQTRRDQFSTSVGLCVPKPSTGTDCQRRGASGLGYTVHARPLAFTAGGGDCHSLTQSVAYAPAGAKIRAVH